MNIVELVRSADSPPLEPILTMQVHHGHKGDLLKVKILGGECEGTVCLAFREELRPV